MVMGMVELMLFIIKNWEYLLIASLGTLLAISTVALSNKGYEVSKLKDQNRLEVAALKTKYIETARDMKRRHYEQQIRAVNEYKEREISILSDASIANDAVSRLSDTITNISATSKLDAQLRDRYIDTSNLILKECTREYSKMGQIADRLSNELQLLSESNRRG